MQQSHLLSNIYYLLSIICGRRRDRTIICGRRRDRTGFTLVEMLVVIVIILVLMGVVFRMSRGILSRSLIAKEQVAVQVWKSLIEEFNGEYGCYPPVPAYRLQPGSKLEYKDMVQPIIFQGPHPRIGEGGDFTSYINNNLGGQDLNINHNTALLAGRRYRDFLIDPSDDGNDKNGYEIPGQDIFVFGLASFFVNRGHTANAIFKYLSGSMDRGVIPNWERANDLVSEFDKGIPASSAREVAFLKQTKPMRDRITEYHEAVGYQTLANLTDCDADNLSDCKGFVLHNKARVPVGFGVRPTDQWHNDYVYISEPPYNSYIFFSQGPDGRYDAEQPDNPEAVTVIDGKKYYFNRDNIYGTLLDK